MERIIYRITLDAHKSGIQRTLQGFETGDNMSRRIAISLATSGDSYEIPFDHVTAMMYVTKTNAQEPSINECTIENNTVIYDVHQTDIEAEGIVEMQVKLVEGNMGGAKTVLCSPKFALEVSTSNTNDKIVQHKAVFTSLENAIAKANSVYESRMLTFELSEDCVLRIAYADGTVYENDILKNAFLYGEWIPTEENLKMIRTSIADLTKEQETQGEDIASERTERKAEIAVERARIDKLQTIPEGGTTSDAALKDISVAFDGAKYNTPGEAVRGQANLLADRIDENVIYLSSKMNDMDTEYGKVLGKKEISLLDNVQSGQTQCNNLYRWFINAVIPKYSYMKKIQFYASPNSDVFNLELWNADGDNLTLAKSVTVVPNVGINIVDIDYYNEKELMLAVTTDTLGPCVTSSSSILGLLAADKSATVLNKNSLPLHSTLDICAKITYSNFAQKYEMKKNVITVGNMNCNYAEIQDALDAIEDDSKEKPYILVVYPKATPYKRFSLIRKLSEDYPSVVSRIRYISIIGIDKYNTIVKDNSGEYLSPPCEALCNGIIKNVRFISTHDEPLANPLKGGYACHIDTRYPSSGYNMIFDNCDFISEQAPAAGIGLHLNSNLVFKDCYFENKGDIAYKPNDNYTNLANYGAVFCHTDTGSDVVNQNITFDNCRGITNHGAGLNLSVVGRYNGGMTVKTYNNMFYSRDGDKVSKSDGIDIDITSYGNNSDVLNA